MIKILMILIFLVAPYLLSLAASKIIIADLEGYIDNTSDIALETILIMSIPVILTIGLVYDYKMFRLRSFEFRSARGYMITSVLVSIASLVWILVQDMPQNYS